MLYGCRYDIYSYIVIHWTLISLITIRSIAHSSMVETLFAGTAKTNLLFALS